MLKKISKFIYKLLKKSIDDYVSIFPAPTKKTTKDYILT